jgi:hypothetical protein
MDSVVTSLLRLAGSVTYHSDHRPFNLVDDKIPRNAARLAAIAISTGIERLLPFETA